MKDFWNGMGIAIVLFMLLVCSRGCANPKPLFGEHGCIIDTYKEQTK